MKKRFIAREEDGNVIIAGHHSENGTFITYNANELTQEEEHEIKHINQLFSIPNIYHIHFFDETDDGTIHGLSLPPKPEWIVNIGWNNLTKTEAIVWTCLIVSYHENKTAWVAQNDIDGVLKAYRRSPRSLKMTIIVDFRIIFTLSGVGGNSDSRLSRRAVAIRRSLLQNKCPINCIFHYKSIRQKIKNTKWHIENLHNEGYRLSQIDSKNAAKNEYINAIKNGHPKHKLATITAETTGISPQRIRRWAKKYKWTHNKKEK